MTYIKAKLRGGSYGGYGTGVPVVRCSNDTEEGIESIFWDDRYGQTSGIKIKYVYDRIKPNEKRDWIIKIYALALNRVRGNKVEQGIVEERLLQTIRVKYDKVICPLCNSDLTIKDKKWKCTNVKCTMDYTRDSVICLSKINDKFTKISKMLGMIEVDYIENKEKEL